MGDEPSFLPLERSVSQQSATSTKSYRSSSAARNPRRRLASHVSSSASSIAASDKSLTSFPSFSPDSPRASGRSYFDGAAAPAAGSDESPASANNTAATTTTAINTTTANGVGNTGRDKIASTLAMMMGGGGGGGDGAASLVDHLTGAVTSPSTNREAAARDALFEDAPPLATNLLPGALHAADDEHIARLVARHGAVGLVRRVAGDLARRDAQMAALRRRADERERALRRMLLECGLSNLELETRLRVVEGEIRAAGPARRGGAEGGVQDLMSDAMADLYTPFADEDGLDGTVRARNGLSRVSSAETKGTTKSGGWKDYLWGGGGGGTAKQSSRASSVSGVATEQGKAATVIRAQPAERRPGLQEDTFSPPDYISVRSSSRASSIQSGPPPSNTSTSASAARKASTSLASLALRLVAGSSIASTKEVDGRGRANSATTATETGRASSTASARTAHSARVASVQGGPKALMAMRRATPMVAAAVVTAAPARTAGQPADRWDSMAGTPPGGSSSVDRQESYGPVEMDTILPADDQPPTLTQAYNYGNQTAGAEYLTDRFGFIYDQRRKRRQRDAARVASGNGLNHGRSRSRTEMLTNGPANFAAGEEDSAAATGTNRAERAESPEIAATAVEESGSKPKKWQDYLKIATFPTELLSHTPSVGAQGLEIAEAIEGSETPRSPGPGVTSDERGFLPAAGVPTTASAAVDNTGTGEGTTSTPADSDKAASASASATTTSSSSTLLKEDAEPVRLLLEQLSEVHDSLQREKTARWNDFLRKVRAERKREGEAAMAREAAASGARFERPAVMLPEATLAAGEMIGFSGLGNKGKVGRAKWAEFKALVLGGIPVAYRAKIWAECSGAAAARVPGYYEGLVARSGRRRHRRRHGSDDAEGVVAATKGESKDEVGGNGDDDDDDDDPAVAAQIRMDVHRTLTDNIFFRRGPGVARLTEVLMAYARRNRQVGYCQGMNLIAANLLLVTPTAEDAFWLLAALLETILPPGYYDQSLRASRADQLVLRRYVADVLPRLSAHLDALGVELEALTFQWFLSVFTDCLSAEALFRVWDVVLCASDGSTFLFQVALALLKLNEAALLRCDAPAAVYSYINHQMTNHAISIDGLVQASEGLRRVVRREEVEARRDRAIKEEEERIAGARREM